MKLRTLIAAGLAAGALLAGSYADAGPRDRDVSRERVVREVRESSIADRRTTPRVAPERAPREVFVRPGPLCARPGGPCE